MEIIERITLERIREAKPTTIWYAANTCWWTHDASHLSSTGGKYDLPCDPRGSVLFMTDNPEVFLTAAENNASHYGKHGLRAFMAAHHLNCIRGNLMENPWSATTWDDYNEALDRLDSLNDQKEKMRSMIGKLQPLKPKDKFISF